MKAASQQFVLCLHNEGYAVSLERGKIYQALPDADATRHGLLRIIDESDDDDLYPAQFLAPLTLSGILRKKILAVA